jgi:hypothetical protein
MSGFSWHETMVFNITKIVKFCKKKYLFYFLANKTFLKSCRNRCQVIFSEKMKFDPNSKFFKCWVPLY